MFFNEPGKPTNFKKAIYLLASTILGVILSFIIHAAIEINYINWLIGRNEIVPFYGACALWLWLQIALWVGGALGGFFLGRFWWRKLYVERIWVKKVKVGEND